MTMDLSNVKKDRLHDLIDQETRSLDVVASWESLCETYRILEFSDELSDAVKLEEFKWIIKEMNKFLTRMSKKLMSSRDTEASKTILMENFVPTGQVNIENRKSLAFQKLKQRWIMQMIAQLSVIEQEELEAMMMEEVTEDGWSDSATE